MRKWEYVYCNHYNEDKKEWVFEGVGYAVCDDKNIFKISSVTYEVEYLDDDARVDNVVTNYIKDFLKIVTDKEFRYVSLMDGTCMGDDFFIFKTNAPIEELKELERISCDAYINGNGYDDVPVWVDVLSAKGYAFTYVDDCITLNSSDLLDEKYPYVIEHYVIENQPELQIEATKTNTKKKTR